MTPNFAKALAEDLTAIDPDACEWRDCALWVDTGCGETIRGVPAGYKYCPYCGKRIVVTP